MRRRLSLAVVAILSIVALPSTTGTPAEALPDDPVPSAGCSTSTQGPVVEERRTLTVNGNERWFLVTVPGAHDGTTPLPLVIDYHGLGEGAQIHTLMSAYSAVAEREGFVVAFPQGQFDPVRWNAGPTTQFIGDPNDDLTFTDDIIDSLGQSLCLDRTRVYASGLSYGAFMNSLLACGRSDRFAAVAPVAGLRLLDPCPQERPVPIITFHGTDDAIVRFNGGFGAIPLSLATPAAADLNGPGIPASVAGMAARNGCDATPTDTQLTDEVIHRVYQCPTDADVEFYIVVGGGHTWPGSEFSRAIAAVVGYTTFDIDASQLAWEFFEQFQLPCPDDVVCEEPPDSSSTTSTTAAPPTTSTASLASASVAAASAVAPSFTG